MKDRLPIDLSALAQDVITWHRAFHRNPELSFQEYATTEQIVALLRSFGPLEILRTMPTGVVARLSGVQHFTTLALAQK